MFKKLIPIVVLTTMIATLVPMTAFAATPVITVSASTTTDPTPALTGTIDDNTATIVVNVVSAAGAVSYSSAGIADAITISGSTWTLANDKITPALAIGSYTIVATATTTGGVGTGFGILTITSSTTPITISSFTVTPTTGFDPSPNGQNEELRIAYSIEETGVSVDVLINNAAGTEVESFNSTAQSSTFTWNGEYLGSIVEPGTYKVVLKAEKTGFITATQEKSVVVSYDDADKPTIADLVVSPTSFNPDDENSVIEFTNNEAAYLTVEIRDTAGKKIRGWSNYENDSFTADNTHSITWNGLDDSSDPVSTGTYKVVVVARNSFGATLQQENVIATSSSNDEPTSNSHISGINFDPSSKFEPAVDDELLIEYDVLATTLDSLKIEAVRGSTSVELFNETNVDKENNLEVTWDGNDDNGDYVAAGTWKIMFTSKVGLTTLVAADTIEVTYAKPDVNDIYVSKDKIDNDLGEFMYVMFRVDEDALVDVNILESGDQDDTLTEDMEVIKNRWYAVQFDGGSYDYDSDLDLEVVAKNKANEDIYTTKKIAIDLTEDTVSSSKSNVTNDFISPVLTNGSSEMELSYDIEEDADVTVTILKGKSSTGTKMIELQNIQDQASGSHTIIWDGKDDDGKKLASGIYTYKVISKTSTTDTEIGYFIIGTVGEIDGDSSSNSDNNSNNNNSTTRCANYTDVLANSANCAAIIWAKNAGIFQGYEDGSFKPFQPISRVQVLKVVLRAVAIYIEENNFSSAGLVFNDITNGAWYIPFIREAKTLGIFAGDGGGSTARPTAVVSRAETLKFIFESLRVGKGRQITTCTSSYTDVYGSNWFAKYACAAKTYGLFTTGTILNPNAAATRGEVASVLYKLHTAGLL